MVFVFALIEKKKMTVNVLHSTIKAELVESLWEFSTHNEHRGSFCCTFFFFFAPFRWPLTAAAAWREAAASVRADPTAGLPAAANL